MAEIQEKDRGKKKKGKQKKMHIHVDFTPMVDMNMLLICFFMLATTMSKPQTMEISVPSNKKVTDVKNQTQVPSDRAVTVYIAGKNKIYYFEGDPKYSDLSILKETTYDASGFRAFLLGKNAEYVKAIGELKTKKASQEISEDEFNTQVETLKANDQKSPIVVIKASDAANYKNLVDVLDEMQICNISKYSIATISPQDIAFLEQKEPGVTVPAPVKEAAK